MARFYTALGPFDSREIAERARAGLTARRAMPITWYRYEAP